MVVGCGGIAPRGLYRYLRGTVLILLRGVIRLVRLCGMAVLLLLGLLAVALVYRRWPVRYADGVARAWASALLWVCGIRVRTQGQRPVREPQLIVSNHVSWLDIVVINSVLPSSFVAKSEVRRWPVVGWLVAGAGTVFIERSRRHAVRDVVVALQSRFAQGEPVGLFPEGTTSDGAGLLPFYASLLEPALVTGVPVQPVALRYCHHGERSALAAFIGDDTFFANVWRVLGTSGLSIDVLFLPPIATRVDGTTRTRHEMSFLSHQAIDEALRRA